MALTAFLTAGMLHCNAEPNKTDVQRVKEEFLFLRFQSRIQPRFQGLSDGQLFRLACKNNNVQCDPVVDELKKNDPEFYGVLSKELK